MNITYKKSEKGTEFYIEGKYVGCALSAANCSDRFMQEADGAYRWERTSKDATDNMTMSFEAAYKMSYQIMPARMYNQNISSDITDMSTDVLDKIGLDESKEPSYPVGCIDPIAGKVRKIAWWRSSVAGAMYTEGDGMSVGTFLPPEQRDASVSVMPEETATVHSIYWPLCEGPRVPGGSKPMHRRPPAYKDEDVSHMFAVPPRGPQYSLEIKPRRSFAIMIVFAEYERERTAWHKMMSFSWNVNCQYVPARFTDEEIWDLSVDYTKSLFCDGEDGFKGFTLGKVFIDGKWIARPYYRFEMGWTGQGIALGANMLAQSIVNGDKQAESMGFEALDSWIKCELPSGIYPTHIMGQQFPCDGRRVVDACNLSAGAIHFFRAWEYAQILGRPKPEYFEAACKICDFALAKMGSDGRLAKSWFEDDSEPAIDNGNSGAFLTLALCEGARVTHSAKYLEGAKLSYKYFYQMFMRDGYSFGGAQDKFSIDKESCIPMLKGALKLYELTHDKKYIDCAVDAAHYLSTWQWQHTHPLMPDSVMGKVGYNSYGGTSVSINGTGQDPYALEYVHDLYDLAELTGSAEWAERAHAAWVHGADGVSDGTLVVNGIPVPRGGQHEAVGIGMPYKDSAFVWMPGWMASFRQENLCRTKMPGGDRPNRIL